MSVGEVLLALGQLIKWGKQLEDAYEGDVDVKKRKKFKKLCTKYVRTRDPKHLDAVRKYMHKV